MSLHLLIGTVPLAGLAPLLVFLARSLMMVLMCPIRH